MNRVGVFVTNDQFTAAADSNPVGVVEVVHTFGWRRQLWPSSTGVEHQAQGTAAASPACPRPGLSSTPCRRWFPGADVARSVRVSTTFLSWWKDRDVQRLLPSPPGPTSIRDAYGLARPSTESGRPWIGLCMVASIDGSTALDGASSGLSNDTDRQVLLTLRSVADMIIVGAGTVRAEGYGPPTKPGQRIGVVSHSGNVDFGSPLFASGAGFLITTENGAAAGIADHVDVIRAGVDQVDLVEVVQRLPGSPRFVQAEGGSSLNGSLAAADLLDEINITTSPLVVGGDGSRATSHVEGVVRAYRLAHLIEEDDFLYSRYVRR